MKEYLNMDKNFIVSETNRLDKFLASNIDASRNQIEQLIKKEYVKVDGKIISKTGLKLKVSQSVDVHFPETEFNKIKDENFVKESLKDKNVEIIYVNIEQDQPTDELEYEIEDICMDALVKSIVQLSDNAFLDELLQTAHADYVLRFVTKN